MTSVSHDIHLIIFIIRYLLVKSTPGIRGWTLIKGILACTHYNSIQVPFMYCLKVENGSLKIFDFYMTWRLVNCPFRSGQSP